MQRVRPARGAQKERPRRTCSCMCVAGRCPVLLVGWAVKDVQLWDGQWWV